MPWIVALWLAMIYVDVWPQMNQKFLLFSLLAHCTDCGDDFVGGIIFTAQFCRQHRFCKNRSPANCATWRVVFWRSNITVGVFWRVGGSGGAFIDDADRAGENNFTQYVASVTNEHGIMGLLSGIQFALTSLFIRRAYLQLEEPSPFIKAAATLVVMVCLQTLLLGRYVTDNGLSSCRKRAAFVRQLV